MYTRVTCEIEFPFSPFISPLLLSRCFPASSFLRSEKRTEIGEREKRQREREREVVMEGAATGSGDGDGDEGDGFHGRRMRPDHELEPERERRQGISKDDDVDGGNKTHRSNLASKLIELERNSQGGSGAERTRQHKQVEVRDLFSLPSKKKMVDAETNTHTHNLVRFLFSSSFSSSSISSLPTHFGRSC